MTLMEVSDKVIESIRELVDYNWPNESENFKEVYGIEYQAEEEKFVDIDSGEEVDIETLAKDGKHHILVHLKRASDFAYKIVQAEDGEEFMEYCYENGTPVPPGTPIGQDIKNSKGEWELKLFPGIFYDQRVTEE